MRIYKGCISDRFYIIILDTVFLLELRANSFMKSKIYGLDDIQFEQLIDK